jgi:hypothetical protein
MFAELLEEIREEMEELRKRYELHIEYKWRWSIKKLMADVGTVGAMDARVNGEGYDGNWTVLQRKLVSILREERYTLRRAKEYELKQKHPVNGR